MRSLIRSEVIRGEGARHRWSVASRVLAAAAGGYALTALATAALSLLLPVLSGASLAESVLTATLCSFILYAAAVMWVFSTRSAVRAWAGLGAAAAVWGALWLALRSAA
jgi:hypothetical protein